MPDIKTKAVTQIKIKAESLRPASSDVIHNRACFFPQEQERPSHLKFRVPPPVRTKDDLSEKSTEETSPESQSAEQFQHIATMAAYDAGQGLPRLALVIKNHHQNPTQPPPNVSALESAPLKTREERTMRGLRIKPDTQPSLRISPNVIQTKGYAERHRDLNTKNPSGAKRRRQQARTAARRDHIKNCTFRKSKTGPHTPKKIASAIPRTAKAIFNAITGVVGAGSVLVLLCTVILAGAMAASPMGILFTDETSEVTLMEAIAEINDEYQSELHFHRAGKYTRINNIGHPPSWRDVVAVFACKTAWANDGLDVITLDTKRVDRLRSVFWDMTSISSSVEKIAHEGTNPEGEADDSYTETILTITTSAKTADDMRTEYSFSKQQNEALDLLLEELEEWGILFSDLNISAPEALALLERLPENLSNERRMVVQYALSLVGKVNYFWGGKSLILGWDARWGTPTVVSAAGSPTTGTTRPYGMDCSGFVDWVFYNVSNGSYVIGQGGGCISQHNNCYAISWSEAQPGDLVFYPGNSHIGIVGGWDSNGNIQIIHCASGSLNGVVITGKVGFTSVGKPCYYVN